MISGIMHLNTTNSSRNKYIYSLIPFRERVTKLTTMAANSTRRVTDAEVLEFYNLATSKILTGLEVYVSCRHDIKT